MFLLHRKGKGLNNENNYVLWKSEFLSSHCRPFNFLNETRRNMTNATSREFLTWPLRSKMSKITGKIDLKFWKLNLPICRKFGTQSGKKYLIRERTIERFKESVPAKWRALQFLQIFSSYLFSIS